MRRHPLFIPSLRQPLTDLAIALLVLAGAALFRYQTHGLAQIAAAQTELQQTREANQARLVADDRLLQTARADSLARVEEVHGLQNAHAQYLASRIDAEQEALETALELAVPLRHAADSLLLACVRARDERDARRLELAQAEGDLRAERLRIDDLERGAAERRARAREVLDQLQRGRRGATEVMSFAALLDRRHADTRPALQVSRDLRALGPATLGLLFTIANGGTRPATALAGGAYVRVPTGLPRCALDLSAGWERWRAPSERERNGTQPAYGATLRFAPLRQYRVWILAGLQRSGAATAVRLGAAALP